MKNRKTVFFLLMLVVALAVADFMVYRPAAVAKSLDRSALVDLTEGVGRVSVAPRGAAPTVLKPEFGKWHLVSPFAGSADDQVVLKLLDALSLTRVTDVISDSDLMRLGRSRSDFSLDDPVLEVTVDQLDGSSVAVRFGCPTPTEDAVYASVRGVDAVFVVPKSVFAAVNVSADGFRRRALFHAGTGAVTAFDIRRGAGRILEFSLQADGWKLGERMAAGRGVSKFLADLTSAEAVNFVWPVGGSNETDHASASRLVGYGLDPDSAVTVTLKGGDGSDRQVSLGKAASDGLVYALIRNGEAIVTVPAGLRDFAAQDEMLFVDSRLFPTDRRSVTFFSFADGQALYALAMDKGGQWNLESPIAAPADQAVAASVLSRILALSTSDVCAEGVSVSMTTNVPKMTVSREGVLGKFSCEDLRSKEILKIDASLVRRIVRTSGEKGDRPSAVVFSRDRKAWSVENGTEEAVADVKGIEGVLSVINPLLASKVEKLKVSASELDKYGLDAAFLTVSVDQDADDSVRRNIIIGRKTKGGRFATVGSSDAVFVIPDETVGKLSADIVK